MVTTLSPVNTKERIQLLDVLRGFAILGIFIVNLDAFSFYWFLTDSQSQISVGIVRSHDQIYTRHVF